MDKEEAESNKEDCTEKKSIRAECERNYLSWKILFREKEEEKKEGRYPENKIIKLKRKTIEYTIDREIEKNYRSNIEEFSRFWNDVF